MIVKTASPTWTVANDEGVTRTIAAAYVEVDNGHLFLCDVDDRGVSIVVAAFSPGQWSCVERDEVEAGGR